MNNLPTHGINNPLEPEEHVDTLQGDLLLWQYIQTLQPDVISRLSQPSREAAQAMERNIVGLVGALPPENFGVTITTNRENLGRLLASAMVNGYFLRGAEQRLDFERSLQAVGEGDRL